MAGFFNVGFAIVVFVFLPPLFRFAKLCSCGNLTLTCVKQERQALLELKDSFYNDTLSYEQTFAYWEGEDCCKWRGIGCDGNTGHVIKIDLRNVCDWRFNLSCLDDSSLIFQDLEVTSSLVELKHLNHLDLSGQYFQGIPIPSSFGSMKHLKYLNLSNSRFSGRISNQLGNLTNLQVLDLSVLNATYWHNFFMSIDDFSWISQLFRLNKCLQRKSLTKLLSFNIIQLLSQWPVAAVP